MSAAFSFLSQLWYVLGGAMQLRGDAFVQAASLHGNSWVALAVVFAAGLSEAFGQSIVLFASKVRPARFILSLMTDALLFAFGYGFLVASTWFVTRLPGTAHIALAELALVIAMSYAPLLFAFLCAMPYLGAGLWRGLHVWHLLSLLVGVAAVGRVDVFTAGSYVWLGWLVVVLARHTFGKPIVRFGTWLINSVAGVTVVSSPDLAIEDASASKGSAPEGGRGKKTPDTAGPKTALIVVGLCVMGLLALIVALALEPLRSTLLGWASDVPAVLRVPLDIVWFAIIAIVVAAVMAPFETLGWWAGWFGDRVNTSGETAAERPDDDRGAVARYIIYLDGIQQNNDVYTPDVEVFLNALVPVLPDNVTLIRGVIAYSVLNRPLEGDPLFSRFWKFVEYRRDKNLNSLLGMFINLRNVLIVAVSADSRYGPMYNFGIAKVLYRSLMAHGYRPRSGTPVTLIGYSGGGQMACGAAGFLKRALDAPVDIISLGGVISGNDRILELEHLYHLVGTHDNVEKIGPVMFASRWPIAKLSYWNRAKRLGVLTQLSLGPVGHQVPGGMFDAGARLADGRTYLQNTLDRIVSILDDRLAADVPAARKPSNYQRYVDATGPLWTSLADPHMPLPDGRPYRPVADWIGRLILPQRRGRFGGAWLEVLNAPAEQSALIGSRVRLRWMRRRDVHERVRAAVRDVNFSAEVQSASVSGGLIMPTRLNRWRLVDPLESLAGAHPNDDVIVKLSGNLQVTHDGSSATLRIEREPVQITGRYYGLVRFEPSAPDGDGFAVRHFDAASRTFAGAREIVRMPPVAPDLNGHPNSTTDGIAGSPLNDDGWYVYGGFSPDGKFVVQALAPRRWLHVNGAARELRDARTARTFVRREAWPELVRERGNIVTAATDAIATASGAMTAEDGWKEGDVGLLVHTYGGIGGKTRESGTSGPLYYGHFAYGIAEVVRDPVSAEPTFAITYYQVYTQNTDGLIAGALDWSRYLGDRQFGWAGVRPVCEAILRHDAFTHAFDLRDGSRASGLDALRAQLEAMTARYRIGDGAGGTFAGAAHNCSQDSNRALFATLQTLGDAVQSDPQRIASLRKLATGLRRQLLLFGMPRRDWTANTFNLGTTMADAPVDTLLSALGSWRCILPRMAFNTVVATFLKHGASATVFGSCYAGGERSDVEPIIPTAL